jgi:transcriptional regulator CtsR
MTELIKLSQLPGCGGYTTLLYVTDKTNDETINELIRLIKLKVRQVSYSGVISVLKDLIDAKNAYADVLEKKALKDLTDETKKDLIQTLDLKSWLLEIF